MDVLKRPLHCSDLGKEKTISEIIKDPREDKKIISNIAKEVSIE